jgi:molybdopterin synthase sulfur carrier subunit
MVKVEFLGPINKESLEIDVKSIEDLAVILKQDKTMQPWLENCAVAINDVITKDKTITLKSGDKVSLLPPVCGG